VTPGSYRFDRFRLDPGDRQLKDGDAPVELNARYLDALALLVREAGRLVTKDRFLEEVWRGVPVTDEALTQCIRTLRRQLGDDAAAPRFIETVPKHGYRFIAPVEWVRDGQDPAPAASPAAPTGARRHFLLLGFAGTLGGGVAGLIGGLIYGFAAAPPPLDPGMGAVSVLLVLLLLTTALALVGAAGVAFGIASAALLSGRVGGWSVLGGALGGLVVGAFVKLLGLDALSLLFGRAPGDITGALEGAALGGAVGLGAWIASLAAGAPRLRRSVAAAAVAGGAAGTLITLAGGRLMGGSLDLLAATFPGSRLRLDRIGAIVGESGFGPTSQIVTGCLEGALFGGCVVGAMVLARGSGGKLA
jgi:DNA-binding winged helix-turn-helix (wHTH) protein